MEEETKADGVSISPKFLKNFDKLKADVASKYGIDLSKPVDDETLKGFKKCSRGRRPTGTSDEAQDIGLSFVNPSDSIDKFKKDSSLSLVTDDDVLSEVISDGIDSDAPEQEVVAQIRKWKYSRINRYIFTDSFGEKCGVFYDIKSKSFLGKIRDIQMNCIREISIANASLFDIYGYKPSNSPFAIEKVEVVGSIFCVGIGTALALGNAMCYRNGFKFAYLKYKNEAS